MNRYQLWVLNKLITIVGSISVLTIVNTIAITIVYIIPLR